MQWSFGIFSKSWGLTHWPWRVDVGENHGLESPEQSTSGEWVAGCHRQTNCRQLVSSSQLCQSCCASLHCVLAEMSTKPPLPRRDPGSMMSPIWPYWGSTAPFGQRGSEDLPLQSPCFFLSSYPLEARAFPVWFLQASNLNFKLDTVLTSPHGE